jgi:hypothetical protein
VWEQRNICRVLVGKPETRRPFKGLGVEGRIILKRMLKEWRGRE